MTTELPATQQPDDGPAARALVQAMELPEGPERTRAVVRALVTGRILLALLPEPAAPEPAVAGVRAVPVEGPPVSPTAVICGRHGREWAAVSLRAGDGSTGLLGFSGIAALAAWNSHARPLPLDGPHAAAMCLTEDHVALLLDVAGPVRHVVEGAPLLLLARGQDWPPALEDPQVLRAVRDAVELYALTCRLDASDERADLVVHLPAGTRPEQAQQLAEALAEHPELRLRLQRGIAIATESAEFAAHPRHNGKPTAQSDAAVISCEQ